MVTEASGRLELRAFDGVTVARRHRGAGTRAELGQAPPGASPAEMPARWEPGAWSEPRPARSHILAA